MLDAARCLQQKVITTFLYLPTTAVCETENAACHAVLRKCNVFLDEIAIEEMPSRIVNSCRVVT